MAVKYYELVCLPTNLYMAVKYYKFVCFQLYKFNTTNLYVTTPKKLAIEKTKNIQICMKQRLHTERKKLSSIKKGLPLEPRYAGICKFTTKIFQTPTPKGGYKFLYKDNKKTSEKKDPMNPLAVHFYSTPKSVCRL
jgi:hypothetical protein